MGEFLSIPSLVPLRDGKTWVLNKHLVYKDDDGTITTVPSEFATDFASVPALARLAGAVLALAEIAALKWHAAHIVSVIAWVVIMLAEWIENDNSDLAAVVHDFDYRFHRVPRWRADWRLFKALGAKNGPKNAMLKRILFYINVRLAGWWAWIHEPKRVR